MFKEPDSRLWVIDGNITGMLEGNIKFISLSLRRLTTIYVSKKMFYLCFKEDVLSVEVSFSKYVIFLLV